MNVYLDDERPAPPGWRQVRWPDEAIQFLKTGEVRSENNNRAQESPCAGCPSLSFHISRFLPEST